MGFCLGGPCGDEDVVKRRVRRMEDGGDITLVEGGSASRDLDFSSTFLGGAIAGGKSIGGAVSTTTVNLRVSTSHLTTRMV